MQKRKIKTKKAGINIFKGGETGNTKDTELEEMCD